MLEGLLWLMENPLCKNKKSINMWYMPYPFFTVFIRYILQLGMQRDLESQNFTSTVAMKMVDLSLSCTFEDQISSAHCSCKYYNISVSLISISVKYLLKLKMSITAAELMWVSIKQQGETVTIKNHFFPAVSGSTGFVQGDYTLKKLTASYWTLLKVFLHFVTIHLKKMFIDFIN